MIQSGIGAELPRVDAGFESRSVSRVTGCYSPSSWRKRACDGTWQIDRVVILGRLMPPVCIPPSHACKRPELVQQNVEHWHLRAWHCPSRHMPHHQATQLLTETAALRCLQIMPRVADAIAAAG